MGKAGDTLGGAAAGASTGAAVGSVVPGWGTAIGAGAGAIIGGIAGYFGSDDQAAQDEAQRKMLLYQQANASNLFGGEAEGNYRASTKQGQAALAALQAQAQGQNSVSALQLQQAMQQNLAQQRSLAAGASPQNSAMAARTAAIQSGRINAGLAGQQAVAGLQERNQAQAAYGNLFQALRGQDLNAALQSRQNAMTGYGANNAGTPAPSWMQTYGPAIQAGLSAYSASQRGRS